MAEVEGRSGTLNAHRLYRYRNLTSCRKARCGNSTTGIFPKSTKTIPRVSLAASHGVYPSSIRKMNTEGARMLAK